MTQDLTVARDWVKRSNAVMGNQPHEIGAEVSMLRAAVRSILDYLEQQSATAQMTVTQEPVTITAAMYQPLKDGYVTVTESDPPPQTDAPPPCEHEPERVSVNYSTPLVVGAVCKHCQRKIRPVMWLAES